MPGVTRFGDEFLVNTTTTSAQHGPTIAGLADGRFVVAWTDMSATGGDTSFWAVRAQLFNADGTRSGSEFVVNTTTRNDQREPTVAALPDGRFAVAWWDESRSDDDPSGPAVRAQMFNPDGTRSGGEFLVNSTTANGQNDPAIAALAGGGFAVTWTDASNTAPDTDRAIRAQVFAADGNRSGGEFIVNATTGGDQLESTVTPLSDGRFAVAWQDASGTGDDTSSYAIRAQLFNANGTRSGTEFVVNTTTDNDQRSCSITGLADGRFVVAWSDGSASGGDTSGFAVRAQVINNDGTRSGEEFLVNGTTVFHQLLPRIMALPDGRFVAVWQDASGMEPDTSYDAIRAQVFNVDGTRSGAEFVVNTTTAGSQTEPAVTALADGRFVVTWEDFSEQGGDPSDRGVLAQIFDPREAAVNLVGTGGADDFIGTGFADALGGAAGTDRLDGAGGNDTLEGGFGSDVLIGSGGSDTAVFTGNRANYLVTLLDNGNVQVIDQRPGAPFGTDTLSGVEALAFADGTFAPVAPLDDVLWRHEEGSVATANGNIGTVAPNWQIRATGDFDADHDADILWRHDDGLVVTWEMGDGQYLANRNIAFASTGWEIVDAGDFDADGDADVLWRHRDGAVVTWEMENGAYVQNHNIAFASIGWTIQGLGDFDRDGDSDIIWRHRDGAVVTWEMEDGNYVQNHNIAFASTGWEIEGAGDFDHDGDDDILWRHTDGAVVTWEMENGNYVQNRNLAAASASWRIDGTGDFDHDGDADVLFRHSDGGVAAWEMHDGSFVQSRSFGVVSNDWHIARIGEFDVG